MRRIMIANDFHKRPKDISTIAGYVECNQQVQLSLIDEIVKNNIDTFIHGGDWFDKGYGTESASSLIDTDLDRKMSEMLNGRFYGLIGNHIRLNLDSNPELFLIQPHPVFKMRRKVSRTEQIIKTPDYLMIEDVQISFMHFNKLAKSATDYTPTRRPEAKKHIALFHSPLVIPAMQMQDMNMFYETSSNSKISECLKGVDLAIVGDIHKPLGQFVIQHLDGTSTLMIVPGSLTNTNTNVSIRHTSVNLPIIEINDGTYKLEYLYFDLKTNLLTFKNKSAEVEGDKLKSIRGNNVTDLYEDIGSDANIVSRLHSEKVAISLNTFMRQQGYSQSDLDIVSQVIHNPENIDGIVKSYVGGLLDVR